MLYNKLMQLQGHKQMFTQLRNLRVYIVKEVLLSEFVPYDSGSHPSHTLPGTRLGMSSWSIAKGKSKSGNIQMFSLSLFSSVQSLVISDFRQPHEPQHARLPCPSPTPRVHPNPCPLSRWCHSNISSSVIPFSSCPQYFPTSGSFQMNQLFASGGQSTGVTASASVLPMNIQEWLSLGLTGCISLQSKGLSTVFSSTTIQKHQFLGTHLSL